jgi:hypothetical protein
LKKQKNKMDNFNLRKYLAEGKLLKEDKSLDGLKKAKPGTTVTVGKDKYVKKAENNMTVNQPTKHLWWQKNKEDKLVHSNELAKLMEGKQLNENAPGYDTRKFGEALPTLESVQAAYEDKEEPRDGVKSAAEKLGMKPSHVKEDSFSEAEIDPNVLMSGEPYKNDYANSEEDYTDSMVIEKIKDIIRYHELDPSDVLEEIGQEFGIAFEFGRG